MMSTLMAAALLVGTLGVGYGPGVHVREADLFVSQHPEWAAPELHRFVRLGAVFPDLRSGGVSLPVNTHDKGLGDALLAVAEADGTPWKIAFAHGYRLHTASDTVAQVFYLPWLCAATDLQQVNLFGRSDIGPVGDNELLIEGYGDLHSGSLQAFVDTAYEFIFDTPEDLEAVVDLFITGLGTFAGDALDEEAARAEVDAFWGSVEATLDGLAPDFVAVLIEQTGELSISEVIELLSSGLFADLLGSVPGVDGEIQADPHEMARLEAHPAGATPAAFFTPYEETFSTVGVAILADEGYADWPWYRDVPIVGGIVSGLALHRPDRWAHHPEVLLWSAQFQDELGADVSSVPAAGGGVIRAVSEVFLAHAGPAIEVTLEIFPIRVGVMASPEADEVVASATGTVTYGPQRTTLNAALEVGEAPADALAYAMRWRVGDDVLPVLDTHWARYAVFADAPLFRPSYAQGVRGYLPTVSIDRGGPITPTGWIRGHAVVPAGHRGMAAEVTSSAGVVATGHPGGGFFLGAHDPGVVTLVARAVGHRGGPLEVLVEAGTESVARIDLRAVPLVDAGAWSPHADKLVVALGLDHFSVPPTAVDVTVRLEEAQDALGTWLGDASAGPVEVAFGSEQPDGARLIPSASADGGDVAEGAAVTIDTTAPTAPVITWLGDACEAPFVFGLASTDDLAPIVGYEASLDGEAWMGFDTTGEGALTGPAPADGPVEVSARALNAAGLWSEVAVASLCTIEAPVGVDAAEASDVVVGSEISPGPALDAGSPPDGSAHPGVDTPKSRGSSGCGGGPPSAPLGLALLALAGLLLQRTRARLGDLQGPQRVVRRVLVRHR